LTVREYVAQVNEVLGQPALAERRIVRTVSVGQDFGKGDELSAMIFYLDIGLGVRPDSIPQVRVSDGRCEER
jgi:hypothetical protein